jgi:hypothetical protein
MNYKAIPKQDDTNVRKLASVSGGVIRKVGVGDILEGDNFIKDELGRDWLEILIINGVSITGPAYVATWVCTIAIAPPIPPRPLPFHVGLNITADSPMKISKVEADGSRTLITLQEPGNYVVEFIANDSEAPFMHMD